MTDSLRALAPVTLKRRFIDATEKGTIGGASVLRELSDLAYGCVETSQGNLKVVAYVLHKFLLSVSSDRDERAVKAAETKEFLAKAHQPMLRAIEFLNEKRVSPESLDVTSALIDLETEFIPR